MAITNTTVVLLNSGTSGNVPSNLLYGQLALNYYDGKLYYLNSSNTITYLNNSLSFATINANGSLILAGSPTDTLSIAGVNGASISACTTTKTFIVDASPAMAFANNAFTQANAAYTYANSIVGTINSSGVSSSNYANLAGELAITNPNTGIYYVKFGSAYVGATQVSANSGFTFNAATDQLSVPLVNVIGAPSVAPAGSLYFSSNNTSLVYSALSSTLKANNYTIETWIYPTNNFGTLLDTRSSNTSGTGLYVTLSSGYPTLGSGNTTTIQGSGIAVTMNAWNHIAFVRTAPNAGSIYVNGNLGVSGGLLGTPTFSDVGLRVGIGIANTNPFAGYMTGLRIVNGTSLYNTTFTPSTSPVTAVANTELLLDVFSPSTYITDSSNSHLSAVNYGPVNFNILSPYPPVVGTPAQSTNTTTGSLVVGGGVGIGGNLYVGNNFVVSGNISGSFISGNGSQLTGIIATSAQTANTANVANYASQLIISNANTGTYYIKMGDASTGTANVFANSFLTFNAATDTLTANNFSGNGSGLTNLTDTFARLDANAAFDQANSAALYANGAFASANIAENQAISATYLATNAYTQANTGINNAAGASLYANGAFAEANAAYAQANAAYNYANTLVSGGASGSYANAAFLEANSAFAQANAAFAAANSSSGAGASGSYANGAFIQANAAFITANAKTQTYYQNTAPTTPNSNDLWLVANTGVMYENFGNTTSPVWAEIGPTGVLANTQPGVVAGTSVTSNTITIPSAAGYVNSNLANNNYLSFNGNNGQIFSDGNFHIHSSAGSIWINSLDSSPIRIGNQYNSGTGSGIIVTGGTYLNNVTISGTITSNTPMIMVAGLASNNTSPVGTNWTLPLVAQFDPNGWWKSSSNTATPSIAGWYEVYGQVWWGAGSGTGQVNVQIQKNGNTSSINQANVTATLSGLTQSVSCLMYCNGSTDTIALTSYAGGSSSETVQAGGINSGLSSGTYLNITLVR
jgi:hypothetical protein